MKKLMKRLLNNKGLTLTELIVALFLTSVILAIAVGMLAPVKNLMNTLKSNSHMDTINATVDEYLRGTLQTAKSLKFVQLKDDNDFRSTEEKEAANSFLSGGKVRAIAVLNIGAADLPVYRLFDFGEFASSDLGKLTKPVEQAAEYGVFNEPFYEGTSCAVEFYSVSGSRLQVASQCFRDGEMINQKHVLSFNLLNSNVAGFSAMNGGDGVKTDVDIEAQPEITGHCYLILYTTLTI